MATRYGYPRTTSTSTSEQDVLDYSGCGRRSAHLIFLFTPPTRSRGFCLECAFFGYSDACVHTCITIDPASVFTTFPAKTCAELLLSLTDQQLEQFSSIMIF